MLVLQHLLAVHPQHFRPILSSSQGSVVLSSSVHTAMDWSLEDLNFFNSPTQATSEALAQGFREPLPCTSWLLWRCMRSCSSLRKAASAGLRVQQGRPGGMGSFAQTVSGRTISRWLPCWKLLSPYYLEAESQISPSLVQARHKFDLV